MRFLLRSVVFGPVEGGTHPRLRKVVVAGWLGIQGAMEVYEVGMFLEVQGGTPPKDRRPAR